MPFIMDDPGNHPHPRNLPFSVFMSRAKHILSDDESSAYRVFINILHDWCCTGRKGDARLLREVGALLCIEQQEELFTTFKSFWHLSYCPDRIAEGNWNRVPLREMMARYVNREYARLNRRREPVHDDEWTHCRLGG